MMHEIKSFRVWQTAKILAALAAIYIEIEATFLALISFRQHHPREAIVAIVGLPIMAAVLGFLITALLCWLYNLVAARIGGIAFELVPRSEN